jgi:DNA-binding LytR/AlgR family response regulator
VKVELKLDKDLDEPKIVVYSNELTNDIMDFVNKLQDYNASKMIIGYLEEKTFILDKNEIESFFTEDSKVYARKGNKKYKIKKKIYELEELLDGTSFVRISNSEIANFNKVDCLDVNGSMVICLKFKSGEITYVSRRYINKIKKYLNI